MSSDISVVERLFEMTESASKRGPQKRPRAATVSKNKKSLLVDQNHIKEVFDFWVLTFSKKRVALDEKRRQAIGAAIHDYGLEACKDAITGCSLSDFHMGRNKNNRVYNEIELILRDSEHIERFLALVSDDTTSQGEPF
jgi:hypothetical protein